MTTKRLEGKVGLFVAVALILMGILLLQFSKGLTLFRSTYDIKLQATSVGGFWSVRGQDPIEECNFRSHLDHFVTFGVVRTLCRAHQQSQNEG